MALTSNTIYVPSTIEVASFIIESSPNRNPNVDWVWDKYSDGTVMMRLNAVQTPSSMGPHPNASGWYHGTTPAISFPSGIFIAKPQQVKYAITGHNSNLYAVDNSTWNMNQCWVQVVGPQATNSNVLNLAIEVFGLWSATPVIDPGTEISYRPKLYSEGVVLYNNPSATPTLNNIVMSDNFVNYDYVEIYYSAFSHHNMTKIFSPNGKLTTLATTENLPTNLIDIRSKSVTLSGNTISWVAANNNGAFQGNTSSRTTSAFSENTIIIYKVVGYRNAAIPPIAIIDPGAFVYTTTKQDTGRRYEDPDTKIRYVIWGQKFNPKITAAVSVGVETVLITGLPAIGRLIEVKGTWSWDGAATNTMQLAGSWGPSYLSGAKRRASGSIGIYTLSSNARTNAPTDIDVDWTDGAIAE